MPTNETFCFNAIQCRGTAAALLLERRAAAEDRSSGDLLHSTTFAVDSEEPLCVEVGDQLHTAVRQCEAGSGVQSFRGTSSFSRWNYQGS